MDTASPVRIEIETDVMFFDTDCGGVVSNIAYLRFVETARTRLTDALAMPVSKMVETGVFAAVARTEIDYRRPARLGDRLRVTGWLAGTAAVRADCRFEIVRPADETLIAECRQVVVLVDMATGRPCKLPETWHGSGGSIAGTAQSSA
ncbi:MAG: acyl-CoA thioesterase [Akkermansiaceae bacterium]|nr:acyl-CoA thioesterase [Akkermansiaceae bacterium]MCP5549837.1 acyl-CoA thioesterase [Akkermansiaceae bacterium]